MKKSILVALLVLLLLVMAACGGDGVIEAGYEEPLEQGAQEDYSDDETNIQEPTPTEAETQASSVVVDMNEITGAGPFSAGIALIHTADDVWAINSNGEKLLSLRGSVPGYEPVCDRFHNRHLLLRRSGADAGEITKVINSDGEIVVDANQLGITGIISFSDNSIRPDSYLFVYSLTEDFSGANLEIGVIDFNGNWLIPLSDSNPLSEHDASLQRMMLLATYLDEGMVYIARGIMNDTTHAVALLNIAENTWHELYLPGSPSRVGYSRLSSHMSIYAGNSFHGGLMYATSSGYFNRIYRMTTNGEISYIAHNFRHYPADTPFSDGLVFAWSGDNSGFYNTDGNLVIDLSDFAGNSNIYSPGFQGDNALMLIRNELGNNFFTLIDRQGNMLFDPIEFEGRLNPQNDVDRFFYQEGIILLLYHGTIRAGGGVTYAYSESGQLLFRVDDFTVRYGFEEGFAVGFETACSVTGSVRNRTYFIDRDGTRAIG